jgi:aminoglycoside phosphotransferase (APT) family kinase protein
VKHHPEQPQRIRPELAALRLLEQASFEWSPRVLGVSDCATAIVTESLGTTTFDERPAQNCLPALGRIIASLHGLRVDAASQMKRSTDPLRLADRVLRTGRRDAARLRGPSSEALGWLEEHRPGELEERRFLHRDLRSANLIVGPGRDDVLGLVDFERACAGDPAWDWVKLQWWCLDEIDADDPRGLFVRGYQEIAAAPDPDRVRWFAMAEAIGLAVHFDGNYRAQALHQIRALLAGAPLPCWRGGSANFA